MCALVCMRVLVRQATSTRFLHQPQANKAHSFKAAPVFALVFRLRNKTPRHSAAPQHRAIAPRQNAAPKRRAHKKTSTAHVFDVRQCSCSSVRSLENFQFRELSYKLHYGFCWFANLYAFCACAFDASFSSSCLSVGFLHMRPTIRKITIPIMAAITIEPPGRTSL